MGIFREVRLSGGVFGWREMMRPEEMVRRVFWWIVIVVGDVEWMTVP